MILVCMGTTEHCWLRKNAIHSHNSLKCVLLKMLLVTSSKNYNSELFKQSRKFIGTCNWKKYKGSTSFRKDCCQGLGFFSPLLEPGFHDNLQQLPGLPHLGPARMRVSLFLCFLQKSWDYLWFYWLRSYNHFSLNHCGQKIWNALIDLT